MINIIYIFYIVFFTLYIYLIKKEKHKVNFIYIFVRIYR